MSRSTRYRGMLTNWNDSRGFGFIKSDRGGEEVFVHVSAFVSRGRRPEGNEAVVYQVKADEKGRAQAFRVWFADDATGNSTPGTRPVVYALVSSSVLAIVAGLVFGGKLPLLVFALYFSASSAAFIAYAWDKKAARDGRWRIAESTLHILGVSGGWPGALAARHMFRHKTRKQSFVIAFWATVGLNGCALIWLLTPRGQSVLASIVRAMS